MILLSSEAGEAAVPSDYMASRVGQLASHRVIGEVRLQDLEIWVHRDLENIFSWGNIGNIDPLAVDVGVIGVVASWAQPLGVRGAGVAPPHSHITRGILQAEARLVTLRHLAMGRRIQEVIVAEGIHAVVMLVAAVPFPRMPRLHG